MIVEVHGSGAEVLPGVAASPRHDDGVPGRRVRHGVVECCAPVRDLHHADAPITGPGAADDVGANRVRILAVGTLVRDDDVVRIGRGDRAQLDALAHVTVTGCPDDQDQAPRGNAPQVRQDRALAGHVVHVVDEGGEVLAGRHGLASAGNVVQRRDAGGRTLRVHPTGDEGGECDQSVRHLVGAENLQ